MADSRGEPPARRLSALPGGLRARLALTFSLIVVGIVALTFLAVDRTTRTELENRIDDGLEEQYGEFHRHVSRDVADPAALTRAARRFIDSQRYHAESRIFLVDVDGGHLVTNHPDLIEEEFEDEEESVLLRAPDGLSDVSTDETGELRVLTRPIEQDGQPVGVFRVADPLESVAESQEELRNAFLIVGAIAIAIAIAASVLAANRITAPLRRMAETAAAVDGGDLSPRLRVETGDEVGRLARSFNGMLDRLERAFERERAFVSDASHELRTPLTVLRGQVDLVRRLDADPEEQRAILESLPREIERMSRLIDEMLELARADDGRLLEPRRFDLASLVADLERDLPLLGDREYVIEGLREGTLDADPDRLSQVFRNLVRNAVEHTNPGDRITISIAPGDRRIRFAVTDTGAGIPPEHLDRVFERFHRVDEGRARGRGGSGLGLAIARALVEAHGGAIWAESTPGRGTTIRFEIPGYVTGEPAGLAEDGPPTLPLR